MKNVYTRKRWIPIGFVIASLALVVVFLTRAAFDHLDRLHPDWNGLSRTVPFFAYLAMLILVFGISATHIKVSGDLVQRYHTPLPFQKRLSIPVQDIEQVLFWQMGYQFITLYGLGVQTKAGRQVLSQLFRTREEVMAEVKKIADALGSRGLTTVKVAETRAAITTKGDINPWILAAAGVLLLAFYRLARF
jgi:hypothetical protein